MTNKELHALGTSFLDKAGEKCKFPKLAAYAEGAKVVAVGDLVRLSLEMKAALEDIQTYIKGDMDMDDALFHIKKRTEGVLKQ